MRPVALGVSSTSTFESGLDRVIRSSLIAFTFRSLLFIVSCCNLCICSSSDLAAPTAASRPAQVLTSTGRWFPLPAAVSASSLAQLSIGPSLEWFGLLHPPWNLSKSLLSLVVSGYASSCGLLAFSCDSSCRMEFNIIQHHFCSTTRD